MTNSSVLFVADEEAVQHTVYHRGGCIVSEYSAPELIGWRCAKGRYGSATPEPPHRLPPTHVEKVPPLSLNLTSGEIKTIIWATGYRPDYSWLDVPVFDRKGMVRHDGGVVSSPGMYLMGTPFLRRRKSTLIDGAGDDARDLSDHLVSYLRGQFRGF
jgi:hypothetical protein